MRIDARTQIYGIIGHPVLHSLSPAMQNAAFSALGMNAVYCAFDVRPGQLRGALEGIRALGIAGANVTIPHKEAVIQYLDGIRHGAKVIGAVNTVVNKNGKLIGYNTDSFGFLRSLGEDLGFEPRGKAAFIIGAGGAARSVAISLALKGAKRLFVTDVIDEKAMELACDVELKTGCDCIGVEKRSFGAHEMLLNSHLLVNATPCGMSEGDPPVLHPDFLHKGIRVFDLIYNRRTQLIADARKRGLKAVGGRNMLLYQGAKAFELWTGTKAPVGAMRKALLKNV